MQYWERMIEVSGKTDDFPGWAIAVAVSDPIPSAS
jgi:hypothetical protein